MIWAFPIEIELCELEIELAYLDALKLGYLRSNGVQYCWQIGYYQGLEQDDND